jgi:hypothetical protein
LDKHTRRYLYERFGIGESFDSHQLAEAINKADSSHDITYLFDATYSMSNDVEQKVFQEQLVKKRYGW